MLEAERRIRIQLREFRQEGAVVKGAGTGPALVEMDRERLLQGNVLRMTRLDQRSELCEAFLHQGSVLEQAVGAVDHVHRIEVNGDARTVDDFDQTEILVGPGRKYPRHGFEGIESALRA